MKRIISILLIAILVLHLSAPVFAQEINSLPAGSSSGEKLFQYMQGNSGKLLLLRKNYGYMTFIENFKSDALSLYLLEMTDKLIDTGATPDKEKEMETLVNIIATYELDRADDVEKQKNLDNLKTFQDYAMDCVEMGRNAVSVMTGNNPAVSELETSLSTAIDSLGLLIDNTDNWISALSNLETIIQEYSEHDEFLKLIEEKSDGELKAAAQTLRKGIKKALEIKLDTYQDVSDMNYINYEEFFFSNVFFDAVKQMPDYKEDEALKYFVDVGDDIVSKANTLGSAWDFGEMVGNLVGDVVVGGEDLINRVLEMMAIYDISEVLQGQIIETGTDFLNSMGKDNEESLARTYIVFSNYLIGCRIRGEYCMYSTVAKDAGLLVWFNKKSAEEANKWYEEKTKKILAIQDNLLSIFNEDVSNEERYKTYADKIEQYESEYGIAKVNKESEWFSYMTGLCFMKLVDFSHRGQEELLLVYQTNSDDGTYRNYTFEIWGFPNKEMTLLDSGELFGTDGGEKHIYLTEVDGKTYLVTGGMDSFGYYYYHGYANGEFGVVREATWTIDENGEYDCFIDKKPVSYDVLQDEEEKWFTNIVEYNLNYSCDMVLKQNEETKQKLAPFYYTK